MCFAYLGPDVFLPLTSVIAGVVGVVLMFGRTLLAFARNGWRRLVRVVRPGTRTSAAPIGRSAGRERFMPEPVASDATPATGTPPE